MEKGITTTRLFQKLDFIDKSSLDLLRKFAFQIKNQFHTLNTTFDYKVDKEDVEKIHKFATATLMMNNDYLIECTPDKDSSLYSQWNGYVYKMVETRKELVFTFSFTEKNLEEIGITIKVFCAGTPTFKVNQ